MSQPRGGSNAAGTASGPHPWNAGAVCFALVVLIAGCGCGGRPEADAGEDSGADAAGPADDGALDAGADASVDGGAGADAAARTCADVGDDLRAWLLAASDCTDSGACMVSSTGGIGPPELAGGCGCDLPTAVDADEARLADLTAEWVALGCGGSPGCDTCISPPPFCAPAPDGRSYCNF